MDLIFFTDPHDIRHIRMDHGFPLFELADHQMVFSFIVGASDDEIYPSVGKGDPVFQSNLHISRDIAVLESGMDRRKRIAE